MLRLGDCCHDLYRRHNYLAEEEMGDITHDRRIAGSLRAEGSVRIADSGPPCAVPQAGLLARPSMDSHAVALLGFA
jgi:hypothetical protein